MGSFRADFFSSGDAQTVSTACGQIAGAIDRAALFTQTDNSLRQRIDQLVALTRVSRELNTTIRLEDLLQRVYSEALRATRADCGSILLFDLDTSHQVQPLVLPKTGADALSQDPQCSSTLEMKLQAGCTPWSERCSCRENR